MQPHITPVGSALSSGHLPQSNSHHRTLVCMSMKGRQTQILVSIRSAHTNAISIGSSQGGTSAARSAPATGQVSRRRPATAAYALTVESRTSEIHTGPPLLFPAGKTGASQTPGSKKKKKEKKNNKPRRGHAHCSSHTHHFAADRGTSSVPSGLPKD